MKLRKRKPSKEVTAQSGAGSSDEDFIDASLPESSRRTSAKRSRKAESPTTASPAQAKRRKPTVAQSEPGEGRRGGNAGPEPSPSLSKQTRGAGGSNRDSQEGKEQFAEGCGKRCNKSYGHPPVSIQDKEREKLTQEILTGYGASSKRAKTESSSSSQPVPSPPKKPRPADPFLTSFFSASASSSQPRPNPIAEPVPAPPVQSTDSSQSVNAASSVINSFAESDSDDDEIWEEVGIDDDDERVGVNAADPAESSDERNFNLPVVEGASKGHFEIIIPKSNVETNDKPAKKVRKRGIRKEDRARRAEMHKCHLLCLLFCALWRNRWCDDPEMQAVASSLLPANLAAQLSGKAGKAKGKQKAGQSPAVSRPHLKHHIAMLAQWWKDFFPTESQFHSKAFTGPKSVLHELGEFLEKPQGNSDRILTPDTSVLLFVAVCRALDIETRLVASLHPVPLSLASNDKVYKKTVAGSKGKRKRGADDENNEEDAKQTPTLESEQQGSNSSASQKKRVVPAPDVYPFRFWCEVYVDKTEEWIPVDPVRGICNDTVAMEPPASAINQLQISYVVACEQGFGVKDVTRRYTSQWGARTIRLRLPQGDEGEGWWQQALWLYSKSDRTAKDTTEDAKLEEAVVREPMPKSLAAYNNHPVYALERHLKKYEIIHPSGRQHAVGVINNELIYPRQLVKELHTPEAWLKLGRKVKAGEEPIKFVKARASTINRKRQIEADKLDAQRGLQEEGLDPSRDASKSALYGEWQTEVFVAPPIVDGKIPRNSFGNIEIFHENMIPQGSVHLAAAGIGKLAKQLGIDYASAVVGFEFRGGRSIPIINGIVVAEEFQEILLLAHDENRDHQMKLEAKKRQRRVVGRWRKIIFSLLTRDWIFREYGKKPEPAPLPDDEEEEEEGDFESDESGDEEGGYREGRGDDDDDDDDGDDDGRMQEAEDEWDEEMGPRVRRRRRPTSHAASEGSFSGDQARGGFLSEEVSGGGFIPDGESPQEGGFLVEDSD